MKRLLLSRRLITAFYSITCLFILGLVNHVDTSLAIASIAMGMAGANAYQKKGAGEEK